MSEASVLPPFLRLERAGTCVVLDLREGTARLLHLGAPLPPDEDLGALAVAGARGRHENQPDQPPVECLVPGTSTGGEATPAVWCLREGREFPARLQLTAVATDGPGCILTFDDASAGLRFEWCWSLAESGVLLSHSRLTNLAPEPLTVLRAASLAMPVPPRFEEITLFSGRWAAEMQPQRRVWQRGQQLLRSQGGRPGFSGGQWVLLAAADAGESTGDVLGAHLAWSGDHELVLERDADDHRRLLMAARLEIGERVLAQGEMFTGPTVLVHVGRGGRAGLRQAFHRHVLSSVLPGVAVANPRKVHLNTWEAVYFHQSLPDLQELASAAAALGVERFVLDDGWFLGRRDDTSSLGDWTADPVVFPEGLTPLISHVRALGMDFGLWVEPEMLSPDSELAREHPEWCLAIPDAPRPTQRHQWVLDLTRAEAAEHVFRCLDRLLASGNIAYLKWDHNRELFPLAWRAYAQAQAHLSLLDRLRNAYPGVEIETCASGGGRVDCGILRRCSRFWASDNNDPVERLAINEGWFQFLPPRIAGNHVGPSPNPITGRQTSMLFRARVAMFGHLGVEADPRRMSPADRELLAVHIARYREWREELHRGDWWIPQGLLPGMYGWWVIGRERSFALLAQTRYAGNHEVPPVRFPGLPSATRYRVTLPEPWPEPASRYLAQPALWKTGLELSGAALESAGLSLPLVHPETAWLVVVEAIR